MNPNADTKAPPAPDVSVVIPCLNEAATVAGCVKEALFALRHAGLHGEVVVADNGSSDDSRALATAAGARVVPAARRGYGAALMVGIESSLGRYIVMGDADGSYDFGAIPQLIQALNAGHQLVQGCRLPSGGGIVSPGAMPWSHRWIGNPGLTMLARLMFRTPAHDVYCGLRAFTPGLYRRLNLNCTGMEFATEMIIKAALHREPTTEVPITLRRDGRGGRPPHLNTFRDGWRTLRLFLLFSPRWVHIIPGTLMMLFGLGLGVLALAGKSMGPAVLGPHSLLVAAMCILVGQQALWMGLFARTFAAQEGISPAGSGLTFFQREFTLEKSLLLGALLCGGGLCLIAGVFFHMAQFRLWRTRLRANPPLDHSRYTILRLRGTNCDRRVRTQSPDFGTQMSLLAKFHGDHVHLRRVRVLAAAIARLLPPDVRSVLDVGCGDGRIAKALMDLRPGIQVTGVDVKTRPDSRLPMVTYDGATLPFPDRHFEASLLIDVLHHTPSPADGLRETARVTSGCVILKDHLLSGFGAAATLRFMDDVGNRRHGVALPHHYLDQSGWDHAYAVANLSPARVESRLGLYPWPASLIFGRRLHFLAKLERPVGQS